MIQEQSPERPRVDMRRGPDGLQVDVDAAGVENVIVRAEGHTLVIDGRRPGRPANAYLVHERVGSLHRELELPAQTDLHRLEASLKNGVLTIRAPLVHGRTTAERLLDTRPSAIWDPDAAPI